MASCAHGERPCVRVLVGACAVALLSVLLIPHPVQVVCGGICHVYDFVRTGIGKQF